MVGSRPRSGRARPKRYHHGDLRRALLEEAARTIQMDGVERLTLRAVAERLGVSRTALYRHFADKSTLLAGVAREGFRTLAAVTEAAWQDAGQGIDGLQAMGMAYVNFAVTHPSHYRVMFGGFVDSGAKDPQFEQDATSAFDVLVNALVALQQDRLIRDDEPIQLAQFVWATVHGVAMLGIDGLLQHHEGGAHDLANFAVRRLLASLTSFDNSHPAD